MAIVEPVLFYPDIDWSDPITEDEAYVTTVFDAWDGSEQRRARRQVANRRISYTVQCLNSHEVGIVRSLVSGGQHLRWLVPMWMSSRRVEADIAADAVDIAVDTTFARFQVGNRVMFLRRPRTVEHRLISGISPSGITIDTPLGSVWEKRNTHIIPLRLGLMSSDIEQGLADIESGPFRMIFDLDPQIDTSISIGLPGDGWSYNDNGLVFSCGSGIDSNGGYTSGKWGGSIGNGAGIGWIENTWTLDPAHTYRLEVQVTVDGVASIIGGPINQFTSAFVSPNGADQLMSPGSGPFRTFIDTYTGISSLNVKLKTEYVIEGITPGDCGEGGNTRRFYYVSWFAVLTDLSA